MADTFGVGQVDKGDAVGGEEDALFSAGFERSKRETFAAECLLDFPQPVRWMAVRTHVRSQGRRSLIIVSNSCGGESPERKHGRSIMGNIRYAGADVAKEKCDFALEEGVGATFAQSAEGYAAFAMTGGAGRNCWRSHDFQDLR